VAKGTNFARRVQAQGNDVWVGTNGGLVHSADAGITWSALTTSEGLGDNDINALLAVGDAVYVGSSGGLTYSLNRGATWTNLTPANGLAGSTVHVIRQAADGSLWVGTNGGVSHGTPQGTWTNFTTANGLADNDVADLAIAPNGSIWLAHDALVNMSSVSVTTDNGQTWTQPSEPGARNPVKAVFVDSAGVVWVSTWIDGVYRSEDQGTNWTQIPASTICTSSSCFVQTFVEHPTGTLWLGTQGSRPSGVSITTDSGATWTKRTNLSNLYALGIAGNGNRVYVATGGGGLNWTEDEGATWSAIPTQLGLPENQVTAVSRGPAGTIWIGTLQTYAAYSADGGNTWTNVTWPYLGSLSSSVQGLWFDEATGTMWIATGNGLFSTTDMGATFRSASRTNGLGANDVRGIHGSHLNGQMVLWAATGSASDDGAGGLSKSLDGVSWTNYTRDNTQYGSNDTFGVFVDSTGKVWGATNMGLRFSSDQGAHWTTWIYRLNSGLPAFELHSVWVEDDGTIWIGADQFNQPITMAKSSNNGSTWMTWSITAPGAEAVGTVVTKDPVTGAVFVGTDQAGLYWSSDGGTNWSGASTTDGFGSNKVYGVTASYSGDIFVATDYGLAIGTITQ
jgi:ligand-binding sensor domain-containing protein